MLRHHHSGVGLNERRSRRLQETARRSHDTARRLQEYRRRSFRNCLLLETGRRSVMSFGSNSLSGFGDGADPQSSAAQQEFSNFLEQENQKAAVQAVIAKLTELCWDKCVQKPGSKLSNSEAECLSNCAERFLDTSLFIMQRMVKKQ
jgi:import inner membrane translocase subunit TIM8